MKSERRAGHAGVTSLLAIFRLVINAICVKVFEVLFTLGNEARRTPRYFEAPADQRLSHLEHHPWICTVQERSFSFFVILTYILAQ